MNNIKVKVIADSINESGDRVTTLECEYPRIVHSELLTHRVFSRNAASSRAIPVKTMLKNIWNNKFIPWYWGANQSGMQAILQLTEPSKSIVKCLWYTGICINLIGSYLLSLFGLHKQLANRNSEYCSYIKVIITSTDFSNFLALRLHPAAQPEIADLAYKIKEALENSKPYLLKEGEWHLPYIRHSLTGKHQIFWIQDSCVSLDVAKKVSVSCCAQVSYRTNDTSIDKAIRITDALSKSTPIHACYSADTEVLTKHGWIPLHIYATCQEDILVVEPDTHKMWFEQPSKMNVFPFKGKLIHTVGQQIDLLTTFNHRQYVSKRGNKGWKSFGIQTSEELFDSSCKYLSAGYIQNIGINDYPLSMELLGFYLGDGSESFHNFSFHLKKVRKIEYLKAIDPLVQSMQGNVYKSSVRCGKWLTENCRTVSKEKKLPDNYLAISHRQWQRLKEGLLNSDGSIKRNTWTYSSTSKTLANQIQTLAHLHGESCSVNFNGYIYSLNFSRRITPEVSISQIGRSNSYSNSYLEYDGEVYCPTVSTGLVLVRRNGKIIVSGNSPFEHVCTPGISKGNLKGWIQYREEIEHPELLNQ